MLAKCGKLIKSKWYSIELGQMTACTKIFVPLGEQLSVVDKTLKIRDAVSPLKIANNKICEKL